MSFVLYKTFGFYVVFSQIFVNILVMPKITYPITIYKDLEVLKYYNVTIPNILGAYTSGEDYDNAIYMAKDLLKLMIEEAPDQCYPPETIEEIKAKWPERRVENITIEVSDEVYLKYKNKMIPELDEISINVVCRENKVTHQVKIIIPDINIPPAYSSDFDQATDRAETIIKTCIKNNISAIHAPIYSQGELRFLFPGAAVFGVSVPINKKNKEIILSNYPEITEAIEKKNEEELIHAFEYCFFLRKKPDFDSMGKQLMRVYEKDHDLFVQMMQKIYEVYRNDLSEWRISCLPIPFLFTLHEYQLANHFLSYVTWEPNEPYIAFLKGACYFYLKDYARSQYYLQLAKKSSRFVEESDIFLKRLEKKALPPKQ